jgi:hypothetical protein
MVQKGNKVLKKIMNCKICMLLLFCSKKEWFEYENVCFCILKMIFLKNDFFYFLYFKLIFFIYFPIIWCIDIKINFKNKKNITLIYFFLKKLINISRWIKHNFHWRYSN